MKSPTAYPAANSGLCSKCNAENEYSKVFCDFCGERLPWAQSLPVAASKPAPPQPATPADPADRSNWLLETSCFFIPILGAILYAIWKDDKPKRARNVGLHALAGVIVYVVFMGTPLSNLLTSPLSVFSSAPSTESIQQAVLNPPDLVVTEIAPDKSSYLPKLIGKVKNNGKFAYRSITISFQFKTASGAILSNDSDSLYSDLAPGQEWQFSIMPPSETRDFDYKGITATPIR